MLHHMHKRIGNSTSHLMGRQSKRHFRIEDREQRIIGIERIFFRSLGLTTRLSEEGIGMETIDEIERRFNERGVRYGENEDVTGAVAKEILKSSL